MEEKNQKIVAGIDVGSITTKAVILKNKQILAQEICLTKADLNLAAKSTLEQALKKANLIQADLNFITSTGYGRRTIEFGDKSITEITANAKGAQFLGSSLGKIHTVIDLGGQDAKIIKLDERGEVADFLMNERCAAGTGRFLEVMAQVLDIKLDDLGEFSLKSRNPIKINATCTVFAESEVISLIAQKKSKEDILAGLHQTIGKKLAGMVRQIGPKEIIFFDGGGAKNIGVKSALEKELGLRIYVPPQPQFVIALGAALIAHEMAEQK